MDLEEIIYKIIKLVELDVETIEVEQKVKDIPIIFINGINKDGNEERYSIYNCSESKFNLQKYHEILEKDDGISTQVLVFKDWDDERQKYWEIYDSEILKAQERSLLNRYFTKSISFYTNLKEYIDIEVDDGINYLEYRADSELEGYVYNVSMYNLKKLLNVTGTTLFKMNVRNGLKKNPIGKDLRRQFRKYLCIGIYQHLKEKDELKRCFKQLQEILEIDENDEQISNNRPKKFWFYHNGITIYAYDQKIDRVGDRIKLNPLKVSVINGAQTLTHFFEECDDLKHNLPKKLKEVCTIKENQIAEILEVVCKEIVLKTICIEGKLEDVRPITYGLNTQIPIYQEDIMADDITVHQINAYLMKAGMKILKRGEEEYNGEGFSVIEFVKRYLLVDKRPGESKNLKKSKIESILNEALQNLKNKGDSIIECLEIIDILDVWWRNSKEKRNILYNKYNIINSYGKNYFLSYVINEKVEELDDEYIYVLYGNFVQSLESIDKNLKVESFKNDELFKYYMARRKIMSKDIIWNNDIEKKLKQFLVEHDVSPYAYAKEIEDFFKQEGQDIPYFRVIKRYSNKKQQFFPKEAFPFANATFSELYQKDRNVIKDGYIKYENSLFSKEINKKIPVFVLDFIENKSGKKDICSITFIKDFSFVSENAKAEMVYNETVEAFEKGDDNLFPKSSEKKGFHVRPKAANSEDTFEFTNGLQITKRTFWANRETINELIQLYVNEKE